MDHVVQLDADDVRRGGAGDEEGTATIRKFFIKFFMGRTLLSSERCGFTYDSSVTRACAASE
jgi:hypothetical protein